MDCAACGKPISVTAKFCGKCGAPVKRAAKAAQSEPPETTDSAQATPDAASQEALTVLSERVEDLVIELAPSPVHTLPDQGLLHIDLNLKPFPSPMPLATDQPHTESAATAGLNDAEWPSRMEQQQAEFKKTLEKHSLLLDFISLAAQQQSHQLSQPNPAENLLHDLLDRQAESAQRLAVSVADLKKQLQELNKKADSQAFASRKASDSGKAEAADSSSFMVFVIGLLCGLTMVLSSLAIYNFLGQSGASGADSASQQPATSSGAGKAKDPAAEGH